MSVGGGGRETAELQLQLDCATHPNMHNVRRRNLQNNTIVAFISAIMASDTRSAHE